MFPTIKGITMLNTRRIITNDYLPRVIIEKIKADEKEFIAADNLELSETVHSLEINYTAPSFTNPQKFIFSISSKDTMLIGVFQLLKGLLNISMLNLELTLLK